MESTRDLPPNRSLDWNGRADYSGNGLFVTRSEADKRLAFLHFPVAASQKPVEEWSIPSPTPWIWDSAVDLPENVGIWDSAVYLPENVVAVSEEQAPCVTGVPSPFKYLATDHSH